MTTSINNYNDNFNQQSSGNLSYYDRFTLLDVECIVLYTGQGKFHGSTGDTLEYIVKQSNVTVDNLRNVSDYLSAAKSVGVVRFFLGPDVQTSIDETMPYPDCCCNAPLDISWILIFSFWYAIPCEHLGGYRLGPCSRHIYLVRSISPSPSLKAQSLHPPRS
ncbi:hypothetical protein IFM89_025228 [Coptis chinensis]|uniref:Uncharacterized protein n=1 Tax=Coptis chinensis TaxID=261450 RepID=A0A835J0H8_9MAGN|nr:hypothetical protein IFM89_025228 [Coptis chinensis]